ncbi:TPA: DUF551 domain-containing protein [Klebsiella quasipneumoniae]|nr:DUF551 domain-containing protein [Klebsiella quasipneumoniae]
MALAAMDSEPVAYMYDGEDGTEYNGHNEFSCGGKGIPLYRHAQPPLVPRDVINHLEHEANHVTAWHHMDEHSCKVNRRGLLTLVNAIRAAQPAPVVPDEKPIPNTLSMYAVDAVAAIAEVKGWNACRAAMLAAAPHDTPALNSVQSVVTVPGKWVPVSEQMPEVGVKVLCFPVKDEPIHATFNGQLWLQDVSWCGSEEPIDNVIPVTVTHWMPLPAAPQEPKP